MRGVVAVVMLVLAGVAVAQELTAPEVIAAQRAGAPLEGILRLIREAPAVAPLTPSELAALRAAGVPEVIIAAMVARTAPPTAAALRPDDPRLADVVRMVKAGLTERLVVEQIRRSGQRYAPSANDLVYLTQNGVPESVIAELLAIAVTPTPVPVVATPTPSPPEATSFGPMVRMEGAFRKQSTGRVVLAGDVLHWHGIPDRGEGGSISTRALKGFWLASQPLGVAGSVVELRIISRSGDDVTFRDADWAGGGSTQVLALYRSLTDRFPQLVMRERVTR